MARGDDDFKTRIVYLNALFRMSQEGNTDLQFTILLFRYLYIYIIYRNYGVWGKKKQSHQIHIVISIILFIVFFFLKNFRKWNSLKEWTEKTDMIINYQSVYTRRFNYASGRKRKLITNNMKVANYRDFIRYYLYNFNKFKRTIFEILKKKQ